VFSAALSNSEKNIAEATSHEVGHNLGLSHDGTSSSSYYTGHGDWAPIMGAGYYRSVTQWSKGEYPGANQLQDDLAIMQNYGISVISDDHGDSNTAATVLSGSNINASGLITTRSDVDVFQFSTGSGNVTLNVNPAPRGGNLDIEAKISDAQGNVLATSNPAGLSASFNQSLPAGVYYLTIDGVGAGDLTTGYSDYASIGQYSITGTLTASNGQPPVAVAGANVTSGFAPLTVNFSSQGSYDPDGTIVSYSWNFGDGTPLSNQADPSHVYSNAGNYTATLTVTDNDGATNSSSVGINVQQTSTNNVIFVNGISMSFITEERYARAVVTVVDGNGAPLPNVTVTGNWRVVSNNIYTSSVTGTTDASGQVTFNSPRPKKRGTYTLDITDLSASGYTYNPSLNVVTSASIQ
jgi:PKD repeat protein